MSPGDGDGRPGQGGRNAEQTNTRSVAGGGRVAYERLLDRLTRVHHTADTKATAACPAHDDRNPSLSVAAVEGRVLLFCHAGCATPDVVAAVGLTMADLFDDPAGVTYRYDGGRRVHRSPDKRFRQSGNTAGRPELYRLAKVVEAVAQGATVYLVEGEQDVHALEHLGAVATTAPMGAGNVSKVDVSPLRGARVIAVPDQDNAGTRWLADVRQLLDGVAAELAVATVRAGKDPADHVAAGFGLDDMDVRGAPEGLDVVTAPDFEDAWAVPEASGAAILDDTARFLARFVAFPSQHELVAVTLWIATTHVVGAFDSSPRLALLSPEPGSGKTRTLEVAELLVPSPLLALNASAAAIFRTLAAEQPTLLLDEVDAIFGRHGKDDPAEDLRALLNAGHRRGATIPRCVGPRHEVQRFPVYAAVALAGLGDLPDTLMSRSIIVRMRRRAPTERVEPFRRREHAAEGEQLRLRLADWLQPLAGDLGNAWPDLPAGVTDRPADVWEPLLAVADAAGGAWPATAREACLALVAVAASREASLGVKLLGDLRAVFAGADRIGTEELLRRLRELEESPWADLRGRPLDARGLARRLSAYGVRSVKVKLDGRAVQGYRREDLHDAWERYLPAPTPAGVEPPEPAEPGRSQALPQVPDAGEVPEPVADPEPGAPPLTSAVPEVPLVPLLRGWEAAAQGEPLPYGTDPGPGDPLDAGTPCETCGAPIEPLRAHLAYPTCAACYLASAR